MVAPASAEMNNNFILVPDKGNWPLSFFVAGFLVAGTGIGQMLSDDVEKRHEESIGLPGLWIRSDEISGQFLFSFSFFFG